MICCLDQSTSGTISLVTSAIYVRIRVSRAELFSRDVSNLCSYQSTSGTIFFVNVNDLCPDQIITIRFLKNQKKKSFASALLREWTVLDENVVCTETHTKSKQYKVACCWLFLARVDLN